MYLVKSLKYRFLDNKFLFVMELTVLVRNLKISQILLASKNRKQAVTEPVLCKKNNRYWSEKLPNWSKKMSLSNTIYNQ